MERMKHKENKMSANNKIDNPMGTDGFEFVEFSSLEPELLHQKFIQLGFVVIGKHKSKNVTLYRQGKINFIVNAEPESQAVAHAKTHGTAACAMGFRVKDAQAAYQRALQLGATAFHSKINQGELTIPAIQAIGGSVIYFIDCYGDTTIYDTDFILLPHAPTNPHGLGLTYIDHLTHNVFRGNMDTWADYYSRLFNFYEIRYFDIKGKMTGLISRALSSPCGKIKIPLNEATDDKSQIEEFLQEFNGEGIQHIALGTDNIYATVESLHEQGVAFLEVPDTYYEMINERLPWQAEDIPRLRQNKILIDGGKTRTDGLLLQIFTQNMFGPEFFEIIQRKGNEGFGEGNFSALFEAIERDQMRRGYL